MIKDAPPFTISPTASNIQYAVVCLQSHESVHEYNRIFECVPKLQSNQKKRAKK